MSRQDDISSAQSVLSAAGRGKNVVVADLTPNGPLTATGPGPWVPFSGGPGWAQAELGNTTTPSAQVIVEACLLQGLGAAAQVADLGTLTGALASNGASAFSGPAFYRLNVIAISGASAGVTGALSGALS